MFTSKMRITLNRLLYVASAIVLFLIVSIVRRGHVVHETVIYKFEEIPEVHSENQLELPKKIQVLQTFASTTVNEAIVAPTCPIKVRKTYLKNVRPLINLNRDRFMLPVLINGPNNQLVGFRKSIYIAIYLNRTIVVPRFFTHGAQSNTVDSWHRVDLTSLQKLIPIVTLDQFRDRCNENVEVVLRLEEITLAKYRRMQLQTGMNIVTNKSVPLIELPKELKPIVGKPFIEIEKSKAAIKQLYDHAARCAVHPFHFSHLKVREIRPKDSRPQHIDLRATNDEDLYSEVVRFTPVPKHIVTLATTFIDEVMKRRPFISVHWRYDKDDWMSRCSRPGASVKKEFMDMCKTIDTFQAKDIAAAVHEKIRSSAQAISDVYIASPPMEAKLILEVGAILKEQYSVTLFTADDVIKFWKSRYKSCGWIWKDVGEFVSSAEMAICTRGLIFLRSGASSWSNNVILERTEQIVPPKYTLLDEAIFDLVQAQVSARS